MAWALGNLGSFGVWEAFVNSLNNSSLPSIDDSTILTGGNFASDVEVTFIDQNDVETAAKSIVRNSSTELIVTRPDEFGPDVSPFTIKVNNPSSPASGETVTHLLLNSVTAGTNPVWTTSTAVIYNVGGATSVTLLATDTEESDIDYSVVSGTLPAGIFLDNENGILSGTFSGTANDGDVTSITIRATDAGGNFLDKAFNFTANEAPTWLTEAGSLGYSRAGYSYSFTLSTSSGAAGGTRTFTLNSGALPSGLLLSSTGLISGTNSESIGTTSNFNVRITDQGQLFADRSFSLNTVPETSNKWFLRGNGAYEFRGLDVGSSDEVLVTGSNANGTYIGSYSNLGVIQWEKQITKNSSPYNPEGYDVTFNSDSSKAFVGATTYFAGLGARDSYIAKLSLSGNIEWQKSLSNSSNNWRPSIAVNKSDTSNGYIYSATDWDSDPGGPIVYKTIVAKYNQSNGALVWQKEISSSAVATLQKNDVKITVDSSENVYVFSGGTGKNVLTKLTSSGSLAYQSATEQDWNNDNRGVALQNNGNLVTVGRVYPNGIDKNGTTMQIFSTSGNLLVTRSIYPVSGSTAMATNVAVDSQNNIFVIGETNELGNEDIFVVKYSSSGVVQWQKILSQTSWTQISIKDAEVNSNDDIVISGGYNGGGYIFVMPNDGQDASTQQGGTFVDSSLTLVNSGPVQIATSGSVSDASLTITTPSVSTEAISSYYQREYIY
jgi:hypothetical protein